MDTSTTPFDWRAELIEQRRTLRWLADETGKSRRTVYAYSRGDLVPPAEWVRTAARVLGKDVAA